MKKEELLKQDNGEALVLKKTIETKRKRFENLQEKYYKELSELDAKLKEVCTHKDAVKKRTDHTEGSYYDRAIYSEYAYCEICGAEELIRETTGSYG